MDTHIPINQWAEDDRPREKLLNNLAVACGPNGPHKMQRLTEVQSDLTQQLPNLLYDPFFRVGPRA